MNMKRIIEIGEQAGFAYHRTVGLVDQPESDATKFAILIIKECASVCRNQRYPANLNYKPSEKFAEAIEEHFEVRNERL